MQGGHRGAQGARVCARRRALRGAARPVEAEVEAEAEVEVEAAAQSESPAAATVHARVEALPTRALKAELAARGVSVLGLSERRELVEALLSAPAVVVAEETEVAAAAAAPVEGAASAAAASAASAVPPDAVESTALWPANIRRECAASSQWLNGPLTANLAAAEHSDAAAQYAMGFRYNEGDGVPHDLAHAALWYRKAADQGFASAQYMLGSAYMLGTGLPRSDTDALKWWRFSSAVGEPNAQHWLGVFYEHGRSCLTADIDESVRLYVLAATSGFTRSVADLWRLGF